MKKDKAWSTPERNSVKKTWESGNTPRGGTGSNSSSSRAASLIQCDKLQVPHSILRTIGNRQPYSFYQRGNRAKQSNLSKVRKLGGINCKSKTNYFSSQNKRMKNTVF